MDSGATLTLDNVTVTGGKITNSGTIEITADSSIENDTFANHQLTVDSGTTLTLDGTTVTGGIITDNGTVNVDATDTLTLNGVTINGGNLQNAGTLVSTGVSTIHNAIITNTGTIEVTSGTLTIDPTVIVTFTNSGTLEANGGTLVVDENVSGSGSAAITGDGTLDLRQADAQTVTFNGAGTLQLEGTGFTGAVSGLAAGDFIHLVGAEVSTAVWNGSTLALNGLNTAFQVSSLPSGYTFAFKSDNSGGTYLEVLPQTLTVGSTDATGVEGSPVQLHFSDTVTGASLTSFVISGIPQGAVLTDGTPGHSYTSGSSNGSFDVHSWNLSTLTITPANDTNFTFSAMVESTDANGYNYTVPATELVTVNPEAPTVAPVTVPVVEGATVALDLGIATAGLNGETNNLNSVALTFTVPTSDSYTFTNSSGLNQTFTAGANQTLNLTPSQLAGLSITTLNDSNVQLSVSATQIDAEHNVGPARTGTELVVVNPVAPTVVPVTVSGTEGTAIALNLGLGTVNESGDGNVLHSATLNFTVPAGDSYTFTNTAGVIQAFTAGAHMLTLTPSQLGGLSIATLNGSNVTLTVAASQVDAEGNVGPDSSGTEIVIVNAVVAAVSKAVADTAALDAGTTVASGTAGTGGTGVLAGDGHTGDSLTVTAVNGSVGNVNADVTGTYGTLHLNADGSYTYIANAALDALPIGSNAKDVFSFAVSDSDGGNVTQQLTFNITGADDTPVVAAVSKAVADTAAADAGAVVASGTAGTGGTGVLAGDSDRDTGDSLTVTAVNGTAGNVGSNVAGTYGTLHLNADGSYSYTANAALDALPSGSNPTDVFSFTVSDGHGGNGNVTQQLTFNITGADDTPVIWGRHGTGCSERLVVRYCQWPLLPLRRRVADYLERGQYGGHRRWRLSRNDYGCKREYIRTQSCWFARRMAWRIGRGAGRNLDLGDRPRERHGLLHQFPAIASGLLELEQRRTEQLGSWIFEPP